MKQLSLWERQSTGDGALWVVCIDGASRGNPGKSGAGVYITKDGAVFFEQGFYLGIRTNNQAEYSALIIGLWVVHDQLAEGDTLSIVSDSELLVRQMRGEYKVKNQGLAPYYRAARRLLPLRQHSINHVLREHNTQADRLANRGVDEKRELPDGVAALFTGLS